MWAWIGRFFQASFTAAVGGATPAVSIDASLAAFAAGGLAGGLFADRLRRTTLTMPAMAVIVACALAIGFLFGADPWLVMALALLWGIAVVADSAQFSSCIIEPSDRAHVGTMLTVQTCVGFLLTFVTVHMMPPLVAWVGWRYGFAPLPSGRSPACSP
jgi:hypothetical protein